MTLQQTNRRQLLRGLAVAGSIGLAGCSQLQSVTGGGDSTRYIPSDVDGLSVSSVGWFRPSTAYQHREALGEQGLYELFQAGSQIAGDSIKFKDVDLEFRNLNNDILVAEGDFTTDDLRDVSAGTGYNEGETYQGYQLATSGYDRTGFGMTDGRGIVVSRGEDSLRLVRAVIDTINGELSPYLGSEPDVDAAEKFLDTDFYWVFEPDVPNDLPGLRSRGRSFTVVEDGQFRSKTMLGFEPDSEIKKEAVLNYAVNGESTGMFGFSDPSYSSVQNVVLIEETRSLSSLG